MLELTVDTGPGAPAGDGSEAGAVITQVASFDELSKAILAGYRDIEITAHLDATHNGLIEHEIGGIPFKHQLHPVTSKTRSIRVR